MEIAVWLSLYRFIFRRPRVPSGAVAFTYHRPIMQVMMVFVVLSAIEIPIIDLIVHQWIYIRIPLLVAGIWGLTWMLGFVLGYLTRPHAVGPAGIRVRSGAEVDIALSWDDVESVSLTRSVVQGKSARVTEESGGATLHLRIQDETNIEIELERPREVRLPQGREIVKVLRIHVDEPRQFMDEVRRHLA